MKYLKIDEQTISDLSIFGRSGKAGIYELYNKTVTQGGGKRLEALFRQPLAEERAINERAGLYRFFATEEYVFPVDSETVSTLAYYMENDDVRSQLVVGAQSIGQRLKGMVAADAEQLFVSDGVQATLRLFFRLGEFIKQVEPAVNGTAYAPAFTALREFLTAPVFSTVRQHASARHETKLHQGVLAEIDKQVRFDHREQTFRLLDIVYELDVCIAIGQIARKKEFHFANALSAGSGVLIFKQVYHPHVENAVANDLRLNQSHNLLFLTGANMAGKSTLMKSIGVALYLGHMGFPVAAAGLEFSVRDGIYTSINLADNLSMGASHYYAEVLRVKEVARELSEGKQLFVIFDELFRGTNVKDAYDATIALTTAFCNKRNSQFIVSTHIMEAGEVLREKPLPITYQYLPTEMNGNMPVYTRILKNGITADRQGMIIIQNEGILEMLDAGLKEEELCHS